MILLDYDNFCGSLAHSSHVVQRGGASVWKIDGKVYAIAGWSPSRDLAVTFKCSPVSFNILKEQPGLRPAPYLASRGLLWIQRIGEETMSDETLKDYLRQSYLRAAMTLTKKRRFELRIGLSE